MTTMTTMTTHMCRCDPTHLTCDDAADVRKNIHHYCKGASPKQIKALLKKYRAFDISGSVFKLGFACYTIPVFEYWKKNKESFPSRFLYHVKDCKSLRTGLKCKNIRYEDGNDEKTTHEILLHSAARLGCQLTLQLILTNTHPELNTASMVNELIKLASASHYGLPALRWLIPDPTASLNDWREQRLYLMSVPEHTSVAIVKYMLGQLPAAEKNMTEYTDLLRASFQRKQMVFMYKQSSFLRKQAMVIAMREMRYAENAATTAEFDRILRVPILQRLLIKKLPKDVINYLSTFMY